MSPAARSASGRLSAVICYQLLVIGGAALAAAERRGYWLSVIGYQFLGPDTAGGDCLS
jgi:hypothetical protein